MADHPSPSSPLGVGLPDVSVLERMANEFFRAVPGSSPAGSQPFGGSGPSYPAAPGLASHPVPPAIVSTPVPVIPGTAPFGSIPATPDPNQLSVAQSQSPSQAPLYLSGVSAARPSAPALSVPDLNQQIPLEAHVPGPSSGAGRQPKLADVPYFLGSDAARPSAPAQPIPALGQQIPAEAELRSLLSGLNKAPGQRSDSAPYFLAAPSSQQPKLTPPTQSQPSEGRFDPSRARADFPILSERVNGKPLIWLDNAATTHKPRAVIERLSYFYEHENSNIHRAAHTLAGRATDAYEGAREQVRRFINAGSTDEIVFVRGTTEAINLVAETWGRANIGAGDEILITHLEHHANIVPWFRLAKATGAKLKVVPVDDNGDVIIEEYARLLGPRVKIVSFTQVSNALGAVTPAALMTAMAHAAGAKVLIDGAQSVSHMRTDVQALDADWFVFSGHKIFAPTGIGALYGKKHVLDEMPPYQSGGNMIADVTFEEIKYQPAPALFEAGTGNIADAVGLGAALAYLEDKGMEAITAHEHSLIEHCVRQLGTLPGVRIIGNPTERAGAVSFVVDGMKTESVGKALSNDGIAVRSGHHCAQPILRRFGVEASVRPSFALYNTHADIDALIRSLRGIVGRS